MVLCSLNSQLNYSELNFLSIFYILYLIHCLHHLEKYYYQIINYYCYLDKNYLLSQLNYSILIHLVHHQNESITIDFFEEVHYPLTIDCMFNCYLSQKSYLCYFLVIFSFFLVHFIN